MYPRLTVATDLIAATTRVVAARLLSQGFELIGVTKAVDGEPAVGRAMLTAGCSGLAESRLPSLVRLAAHALAPLTLIRAPQLHEIESAAQTADRVVLADTQTASALGAAAPGYPIELLLGVDLGDRREGVLPEQAPALAERLAQIPGTVLRGISVNFACLSGQLPTIPLIRQAEDLALELAGLCTGQPVISVGGTCCVPFTSLYRPRVRTEIRSGVGLLFGWDLCADQPLEGLGVVEPTLAVQVLESSVKPPPPAGPRGLDAFGRPPDVDLPEEEAVYTLVALGRRDAAPEALRPIESGVRLVGMTSDVAVLLTDRVYEPGEVIEFALSYEGLVRAMTSPFVTRSFTHRTLRRASLP